MKDRKTISAMPYFVYFWTVVLLTVAGLADSLYLVYSHHRTYTDIGYQSFCALSESVNCDTVSQSPYSIFMGLPLPIWGTLGHIFVLALLILGWRERAEGRRIWPLLFCVSLFFSGFSLYLAWLSRYRVHSLCIMCFISYGISFMLLYYCWLIRRRFDPAPFTSSLLSDLRYLRNNWKSVSILLMFFAVGIVSIYSFMPKYWKFAPAISASNLPTGITPDGHPWIGAEDPELTIVEFSDYQCFQCNKMHFFLRYLVSNHPRKLRLIHRHFPMDHEINSLVVRKPLHIGSGKLAKLAIYAALRNKFWVMSDYLFSIARTVENINIGTLAEVTGLPSGELAGVIHDKFIHDLLRREILEGMKLRVTGTPTFFVNGRKYNGRIPDEILANYFTSDNKDMQ